MVTSRGCCSAVLQCNGFLETGPETFSFVVPESSAVHEADARSVQSTAQGEVFLRKATEIKNIWIPYGE
jgi:hypothetical protein